jgi:preprotein translocase SecE subunit
LTSESPKAPEKESGRGLLGIRPYKEEQGRLVRLFAFWGLGALLLYASVFLFEILSAYRSLQGALGGARLPVVRVELSPAFLVAAAVFMIGFYCLWRWQQTPKVADHLIETEGELRKITWPTGQDVINNGIVVIVFVIALGAFLAAADWVLSMVVKWLILGEV